MRLLFAFLLMAVIMAAVWLVQRRMGDAGVVDVAWTYGIGLVVLFFAAYLLAAAAARIRSRNRPVLVWVGSLLASTAFGS